MTTLASGVSLRSVGAILSNAATVGRAAWRGGEEGAVMAATPEPTLSADILDLFGILQQRGIEYLLVGGVALLRYVEGRNTEDIDLVLSLESLNQLPEIQISDSNRDFARGRFRSVRVDVLLTANPFFKLVAERHATAHRFHEQDVRWATVEGLTLLKLYALPALYRQGQGQRIALYEADITMLCQRHRPRLPPLLETLKAFVDADAHRELVSIARDIEARIARIDRASNGGPT